MDIKRFHVGDTVFTLAFPPSGKKEKAIIREMYVRKVGKKYLHTAGDMLSYDQTQFHAEPDKPYLVQNLNAGYPMLLFGTREEAEGFVRA